jgi:hypothetical protein
MCCAVVWLQWARGRSWGSPASQGSTLYPLFPHSPLPPQTQSTRIKYVTDGVLLREMMDDPLLTRYRCPG